MGFGQGLTGHQLAGHEQLGIFLHYLFFLVLFPFGFKRQGLLFAVGLFLLIKLSLTQPMSFCTFTLPIVFPIPLERTERTAVLCSAAYWGYTKTKEYFSLNIFTVLNFTICVEDSLVKSISRADVIYQQIIFSF